MPNVLKSKANQAMKLDQVKKYNEINFFFKKHHAENEARRLVPHPRSSYFLIIFYMR